MALAVADLSHQANNSVVAPSQTLRVLLVHGCPLFRVGLRSLLEHQSDCHLVGEATCGEEALSLARNGQPDVVLLDGSLTTPDPLDLVQQLRQLGVPGILVFAPPMGDEETLFRFLLHGATAYEDAWISGEDLLAAVRRAAQGECLVTGEVLTAQAARRERLARLRRNALLAADHDPSGLSGQVGVCSYRHFNGQETRTPDASCSLSERDRAILAHIARGRTNTQIAQALGVGPHIVKNRLDRLFQQLHIHDRTTAVVLALRHRWITLDGIRSLSL